MPQRLIVFVLLAAYGMPAVVGHGLHHVLPCAAGGHDHSGAHCHGGAARIEAGFPPGIAWSTSSESSRHDAESCAICKYQRTAQTAITVAGLAAAQPVVAAAPREGLACPRKLPPEWSLARGPPPGRRGSI